MTEIATREGSGLALRSDQEFWTDKQAAALAQLGVADASNADLAVFLHVAQRSGLDPFARQIYMIGRWSAEGTKQTIQTGIDGYRLIARRAATAAGEKLAEPQPLWCGQDMKWLEAWPFDEPPAAAKVVVYRDGEPFGAVAMYREFCQRNRRGEPMGLWQRMPANQLAKCAEAQALRKAYPQELSGIYVDEEMQQASNPSLRRRPEPPARVTVDELHVPDDEQAGPTTGQTFVSDRQATQKQVGSIIGRLRDLDVETDDDQRAWLTRELGRDVDSRSTLTRGEAQQVMQVLDVLEAERGELGGDA
jgi:phage recombination protein Bet